MNRIKFIPKNGVEKLFSLDDLLLSKNNPRFTMINSFNDDLAEFIKGKASPSLKQLDIFKKLIYSEGDLSDLRRLIENIDRHGFNNQVEHIILVQDIDNSKFVVAEGNRRVMCLKILFDKNFTLPKLDSFEMNLYNYPDENSEKIDDILEEEEDELKIIMKIRKNYSLIENSINNIRNSNKNFEVHYEIATNSDDLWKIIYDKHLTGERPGMRKWSRAKYFADLLNVFKDGIIEDDKNNSQIFQNIRRESNVVVKDFKSAQFVYAILYFKNKPNFQDEEIINFSDEYILKEMLTLKNISALEQNHSYNKIKKIMCDDILLISGKEFSDKYAKISYKTKNNRIILESYKISLKKVLSYIYEIWINNILTTRPIQKQYEDQVLNDLKLLLNNVDINNQLTYDELMNINEFDLSANDLKKIILVQQQYHKEEIIFRFQAALRIKKQNNDTSDMIDKKISEIDFENFSTSPLYVFKNIKDQLIHNSGKKTFLNAIFISIRSFFEQLLMWSNCINKLSINFSDEISKLCKEPTHRHFNEIKQTFIQKINDIENINDYNISSFLENILKHGSENSFFSEIKKNFISIISDDKWNGVINENIHSAHRIYIRSLYNNYLIEFEIFSNFVHIFFSEIDFSKFVRISDAIEKYIKTFEL